MSIDQANSVLQHAIQYGQGFRSSQHQINENIGPLRNLQRDCPTRDDCSWHFYRLAPNLDTAAALYDDGAVLLVLPLDWEDFSLDEGECPLKGAASDLAGLILAHGEFSGAEEYVMRAGIEQREKRIPFFSSGSAIPSNASERFHNALRPYVIKDKAPGEVSEVGRVAVNRVSVPLLKEISVSRSEEKS